MEEARAERLSNLIRFSFAFMWLATTSFYLPTNLALFNAINMGSGFLLFFAAVSYHFWLMHHAYRPYYKYAMTTLDMVIAIGILVAYAIAAGPVFVLKMPIYLTVPCSVGLAALRIQRRLAIYAGTLAIVMLVGFWAWMQFWYGIDYGTRMEHAFGAKVNPTYLIDTIAFLMGFALLSVAGAYNINRQVELRVETAEGAARDQERALMSAGLAHEIKNPLGGIYGAAQLLRDEDKGDKRYTQIILSDARRLNDLVEGFLRFSRPFPIHPKVLDLNALVWEFCRSEASSGSAIPVEFLSAHEALDFRTDAEAVRQILLNLVQNARRFQRPGMAVRIRLAGDSGEVSIRVEDDGPGIPEDLRRRLFAPFQSGQGGGTGLGLSLSRKIALELGGDLSYRPLNPGAQFTIRLRTQLVQATPQHDSGVRV